MADVSYPVIFSAPMVQALFDGRKTQTRRLAWSDASGQTFARHHRLVILDSAKGQGTASHLKPTPWKRRFDKFQAGERPWLWTKETFAEVGTLDPGYLVYRATYPEGLPAGCENVPPASGVRWTPSIHMPKRLSRLSLRVTDMRMERLQAISEEDARAEGIEKVRTPHTGWRHYQERDGLPGLTSQSSFSTLWNSIHGAGAWAANPECIVTQFEVHRENIERITHG